MEHCFPSDVSLYNCGLSVVSVSMSDLQCKLSLQLKCYLIVDRLILFWYLLVTGFTIMSKAMIEMHGDGSNIHSWVVVVCFGKLSGSFEFWSRLFSW